MTTIALKIFEILNSVLGTKGTQPINFNTSLVDDLGMDSLDLIEITVNLESEFGVCIEDEDFEKRMLTVADIISYVEANISTNRFSTPSRPSSVWYEEMIKKTEGLDSLLPSGALVDNQLRGKSKGVAEVRELIHKYGNAARWGGHSEEGGISWHRQLLEEAIATLVQENDALRARIAELEQGTAPTQFAVAGWLIGSPGVFCDNPTMAKNRQQCGYHIRPLYAAIMT